jgi:hypothetical protein
MPYARKEDHNAQVRRWQTANPDKVRALRARQNARPEVKLQKQKWAKENPEKIRATRHHWNINNRKYYRNRMRKLRQDPIYRLLCCCRCRVKSALRAAATSKRDHAVCLLGCTPRQFKQRLESLFLPGMSWANRHLWHIDHKKPISSFDLTTEAGQRAAFHYTNTQPLWAVDNLRKGAKV